MTNQITSKLAAFGVALLVNSFLLGGVAYLFNTEAQASTQTLTLAQNSAQSMDAALTQTDAV